jgi:hypothetical protein
VNLNTHFCLVLRFRLNGAIYLYTYTYIHTHIYIYIYTHTLLWLGLRKLYILFYYVLLIYFKFRKSKSATLQLEPLIHFLNFIAAIQQRHCHHLKEFQSLFLNVSPSESPHTSTSSQTNPKNN